MKNFIVATLLTVSMSVFADYDYTITNGYFYSLTLENTQTLLMTGGGGDLLTCKDYSIAEIKNTSSPLAVDVGGLWDLISFGWSQLDFSGGHINHIDIGQNANAVLSGGLINEIISGYLNPNPEHIKVICKSATYNPTTKYLNGIWKDDTAFSIKFLDRSGYSSVVSNITIIPEPITLALLALGGLLIHRK